MDIAKLFRIWSKSQNKYITASGYQPKTSWKKKAFAIGAAEDLIRHHGHVKGDLEVHEFRIETVPSIIHPV
jgi:hypothetical protein